MKKCMKNLWMFAALAVMLSPVAGCGGDDDDKVKEIAVTALQLSQSSLTLNPGDKIQVNVTVLPADATNKSYGWTSDNPTIATVTAGGLVEGKTAGTTKVWAKTSDGKVSASVDVTVQDIDPGNDVAGVYPGAFQIQGEAGALVFSVPMEINLEYKSLGKVSFSAPIPEGGIPGYVVDPNLPETFKIPVTLSCPDVTVTKTDNGYSLAGSGTAIVPPEIMEQLMGTTMSPPMTISEGTIDSAGKLYLKIVITGVGEVFFRGT